MTKMYKYKCSCGNTWFSDYGEERECDNGESEDEEENDVRHTVKQIKTFTSDDYAELWEMELESANRHSLTDIPTDMLALLRKHVKDEKIIKKILKELSETGMGCD